MGNCSYSQNSKVVCCEEVARPISPSSDKVSSEAGSASTIASNADQQESKECNYSELMYKRPRKNFGSKKERKAFVEEYKAKEKTELCRNWQVYGTCKHGSNCSFAHGENELRRKPNLQNLYKTRQCKQFNETNACPYGARCQYIHNHLCWGKQILVPYTKALKENVELMEERMSLLEDPSNPPELSEHLIYTSTNARRRLNVLAKLAGDK